MKNTGITWKTQVSHWVQAEMLSMWSSVGRPSTTWGAAISQCPVITAVIESARRKST